MSQIARVAHLPLLLPRLRSRRHGAELSFASATTVGIQQVFDGRSLQRALLPACALLEVPPHLRTAIWTNLSQWQELLMQGRPGTYPRPARFSGLTGSWHADNTAPLLRGLQFAEVGSLLELELFYINDTGSNDAALRFWLGLTAAGQYQVAARTVLARIRLESQRLGYGGRFLAFHLRAEQDWLAAGRWRSDPKYVANLLLQEGEAHMPVYLATGLRGNNCSTLMRQYLDEFHDSGLRHVFTKDTLAPALAAAGAFDLFDFNAAVEMNVLQEADLVAGTLLSSMYHAVYLRRAAVGRRSAILDEYDDYAYLLHAMGFPDSHTLAYPPVDYVRPTRRQGFGPAEWTRPSHAKLLLTCFLVSLLLSARELWRLAKPPRVPLALMLSVICLASLATRAWYFASKTFLEGWGGDVFWWAPRFLDFIAVSLIAMLCVLEAGRRLRGQQLAAPVTGGLIVFAEVLAACLTTLVSLLFVLLAWQELNDSRYRLPGVRLLVGLHAMLWLVVLILLCFTVAVLRRWRACSADSYQGVEAILRRLPLSSAPEMEILVILLLLRVVSEMWAAFHGRGPLSMDSHEQFWLGAALVLSCELIPLWLLQRAALAAAC